MRSSGNAAWAPGDTITAAKLQNIENALKALEVVSALPVAGTAGRMVLLSTDLLVYRDTGTAWGPAGTPSHLDPVAALLF